MCAVISKNTIFIQSAEGKENVFCILHMLRIYTGLQKLMRKNVYDLHIKRMNQFYISKPCINIAKSEVLFEQYIMSLKRDKYDIEVQDYDAIKCNRIFLISCHERSIV